MTDSATEMDAVAMMIWLFRLIVPCVLFWISFGPKIRIQWPWQGPCYSRESLLTRRAFASNEDEGPPDELVGFTVLHRPAEDSRENATKKTEPKEHKSDRDRGDRDREKDRERERRDSHKERRGSGKDVALSELGDNEDHPSVARDDRRGARGPRTADLVALTEADRVDQEAKAEKERQEKVAKVQRMQVESLVNFVSFNRYRQRPHFCLEKDACPPPPLHKPPGQESDAAELQAPVSVTSAARDRANSEAQMVLRGAIATKAHRVEMAKSLRHHLADLGVGIAVGTYELLVDACVQANNLSVASEFLMLMEAAGHVPSNELLDKVMLLYLDHKQRKNASAGSRRDGRPHAPSASGDLLAGDMHSIVVEAPSVPPPPPPRTLQSGLASHAIACGAAPLQPCGLSSSSRMQGMRIDAPWESPTNSGVGAHWPHEATPPSWHPQADARFQNVIPVIDNDLPAFSVPDEFATRRDVIKEPSKSLRADAEAFVPTAKPKADSEEDILNENRPDHDVRESV